LSTSESQPEAETQANGTPDAGGPAQLSGDQRETHSRLYPDALEKISTIFGEHLKDVLDRHRRVETLTGEKNVIGRQNLVEAGLGGVEECRRRFGTSGEKDEGAQA
jgi:hypothetical protein